MSLKPICTQCRRFYKPLKTGVWFLEGMPKHNDARPGLADGAQWRPYKLWHGDLLGCHGCGHTIIAGVAREPYAEHYMDDFAAKVEACQPILQVNDC